MRHILTVLLALLAPQSLAACPTASDMPTGVTLHTQPQNGETTAHVFQASGASTVTKTEQIQLITVNNTTRTWLTHGLFPTKSRLLKSTAKTPVIANIDYTYASNVKTLTLKPNSHFTIVQTRRDYDGFAKRATLTYTLGAAQVQTLSGCPFKTVTVTMLEDWRGTITSHKITYFTDLGFGFTTEIKRQDSILAFDIKEIVAP